jgi:hypothetical protein
MVLLQKIKIGLVIFIVLLGFAGSIAGSYLLSLNAIRTSNQNWCTALVILTKHPIAKPANPKATPSRQDNYTFYLALVNLRSRYGCKVE